MATRSSCYVLRLCRAVSLINAKSCDASCDGLHDGASRTMYYVAKSPSDNRNCIDYRGKAHVATRVGMGWGVASPAEGLGQVEAGVAKDAAIRYLYAADSSLSEPNTTVRA